MRTAILFLAGFVLAAGLVRTVEAVACCFQSAENAPITLTALYIDGEPADAPTELDTLGHNLTAGWEGIELTVLDEEGYSLGGESFSRRVR